MNKLTFKVVTEKEVEIASLIKEVSKIACRIKLDINEGLVMVQNIEETMIDTIIELVNRYYTIIGVEIDNIAENSTESESNLINEQAIEEPVNAEISNTLAPKEPIIVEPQSEDDLIIKKVEFQNEYVENLINKFLRTAYWAMFQKNISEKEIGNFIYTSMREISMSYSSQGSVEVAIGDIFDCNYGFHLPGEINGGHVHAIVCHIAERGMVYLVPITKANGTEITSYSYLEFTAPNDVIYYNDHYKGGTALFDKGKYVRIERLNELIGRSTPTFFEKVLRQLATTFDFINGPTQNKEKVEIIEQEKDIVEVKKEKDEVDYSTSTEIKKAEHRKIGSEEEALLEVIGCALDKLDASKPIENQVQEFLKEIGMPAKEEIIQQSFISACNIKKKISYENILSELTNLYPHIDQGRMLNSLKENFKNWLANYPELAKKCPRISLISILKVFAKRISRNIS